MGAVVRSTAPRQRPSNMQLLCRHGRCRVATAVPSASGHSPGGTGRGALRRPSTTLAGRLVIVPPGFRRPGVPRGRRAARPRRSTRNWPASGPMLGTSATAGGADGTAPEGGDPGAN